MNKQTIIVTSGLWHHEIAGGAYKVTTEFAEYLADQGYKVFLIAASKEVEISNPTMHGNLEVWRYKSPTGKSPSLSNLVYHITQSGKLVETIAQHHQIDHVNGHDYVQFFGVIRKLKREGRISTSFGVHSPLVLEHMAHWEMPIDQGCKYIHWNIGVKRAAALKLFRGIEKSVYKQADIIITDSQFTLDEITRDYAKETKGKVKASHLWVDLARYRLPLEGKIQLRRKLCASWKTDETETVFFTLRRLVPRMGIDNLIKAMLKLKVLGHKCRLIIGGGGPERDNLEQLSRSLGLEDQVVFVGRISEEDLPICYQAADCFLLPTKSLECFGLIILESFACGTPVIATPVGSIPEIMGDIGHDFLAEDTSVDALASKMDAFIEGGIEYSENNLREYAEQFSFQDRVKKLTQYLIKMEK